jgi:hypothetical protein
MSQSSWAPPPERRVCTDCGATAPVTQTPHTLISRAHGWRLLRVPTPQGQWDLQWRCSPCWQKYKAQGGH